MHSFSTQVTVHAISIKIYQLVVYSLTCKLNNAVSGVRMVQTSTRIRFYGQNIRGVQFYTNIMVWNCLSIQWARWKIWIITFPHLPLLLGLKISRRLNWTFIVEVSYVLFIFFPWPIITFAHFLWRTLRLLKLFTN